MTCHNCRIEMVKAGFYGRNKVQRFKCQQCGKRFAQPQEKPFGGADVRLPLEKVRLILHCLVEGNSVRSTARLCDVEKRTVLNMLTLAGDACERILAARICNVQVKDMQLDEVWTFVQKKQKRIAADESDQFIGDAYTFIGLERNSKLVVAWHLGKRDRINTEDFISKLRRATADGEFELCTDGFQPYVNAIDTGLSDRAVPHQTHSIILPWYTSHPQKIGDYQEEHHEHRNHRLQCR